MDSFLLGLYCSRSQLLVIVFSLNIVLHPKDFVSIKNLGINRPKRWGKGLRIPEKQTIKNQHQVDADKKVVVKYITDFMGIERALPFSY